MIVRPREDVVVDVDDDNNEDDTDAAVITIKKILRALGPRSLVKT